jgi:CRP/FNR family transcriptional regulator
VREAEIGLEVPRIRDKLIEAYRVRIISLSPERDGANQTKIDLKIEALRGSWLFSDMDAEELREIASLAAFRRFRKGELILCQGDPPNFLYVITSGKVKQFKTCPSGKAFTTAINAPGDPLNVTALFGAGEHFVTIQAISDTNTLFLSSRDFLAYVEKHPIIMQRVLYTASLMINSAYERLSDFAGETAAQRVLNVLFMLFFKFGDAVSFTREEIADVAGTTAETTIRVLGKLKAEGIIRSRRGGIDVLDKEKLRDVCRRSYLIPLRDLEGKSRFIERSIEASVLVG